MEIQKETVETRVFWVYMKVGHRSPHHHMLLSPLVRLVSDRNPFHTASLDVQEVERVETDHMKEVKGRKNLM